VQMSTKHACGPLKIGYSRNVVLKNLCMFLPKKLHGKMTGGSALAIPIGLGTRAHS
jgi:hypothetical protein